MELRHLRQFCALAQTLNFRRAAEQLNIAQPPLSVSIGKLEAELGVKLFERHQRGVRLTPAGEAALPLAQEAIARAEEIRDAVGAIASGRRGQLRIGFVSSAAYSLAPRITAAFRRAYPEVDLLLEEVKSMEILVRVEANSLDLGIVRTPLVETTQLALSQLETTEMVLAVPRNHRLHGARTVKLESLKDESFIMYDRSIASSRALVLLSCQNAGFVPRVAHTAAQIHTILGLVEMGLGVALVPSILGKAIIGNTRTVKLTVQGRPIPVGLALVRRAKPGSTLVSNFCEIALKATSAEAHA